MTNSPSLDDEKAAEHAPEIAADVIALFSRPKVRGRHS